MKTWKLISGIINVCLFFFVSFQSCAVGLYNSLDKNGNTSGSSGLVVAFLILICGCISITCHNNVKKGNIALIIIFSLAIIIAWSTSGVFGDLIIWGFWCFICAAVSLIGLLS